MNENRNYDILNDACLLLLKPFLGLWRLRYPPYGYGHPASPGYLLETFSFIFAMFFGFIFIISHNFVVLVPDEIVLSSTSQIAAVLIVRRSLWIKYDSLCRQPRHNDPYLKAESNRINTLLH